jgi:hypothetical protein
MMQACHFGIREKYQTNHWLRKREKASHDAGPGAWLLAESTPGGWEKKYTKDEYLQNSMHKSKENIMNN